MKRHANTDELSLKRAAAIADFGKSHEFADSVWYRLVSCSIPEAAWAMMNCDSDNDLFAGRLDGRCEPSASWRAR